MAERCSSSSPRRADSPTCRGTGTTRAILEAFTSLPLGAPFRDTQRLLPLYLVWLAPPPPWGQTPPPPASTGHSSPS